MSSWRITLRASWLKLCKVWLISTCEKTVKPNLPITRLSLLQLLSGVYLTPVLPLLEPSRFQTSPNKKARLLNWSAVYSLCFLLTEKLELKRQFSAWSEHTHSPTNLQHSLNPCIKKTLIFVEARVKAWTVRAPLQVLLIELTFWFATSISLIAFAL